MKVRIPRSSVSLLYSAIFGGILFSFLLPVEAARGQFRNPNEVDTTPAGTSARTFQNDYGSQHRSELIRKLMPHILHPEFENAIWGIHVVDLNTGAPLFSRNARTSMMPASNTKLYTTAAALELMGAEFRYQTRLWTTGSVENGVLRGNLIVEGSGDPSISGRFTEGDRTFLFRAWADSLKARGITRIEGDIIGDDRIFDTIALGRSWSWDYTTYWYAAEMGALSFNENCVDAEIIGTEVGQPAIINIEPHGTSYVQIVNETMTVHPDSSRRTSYHRPWGTNTIFVGNHVAPGDTIRYSLSVTNTSLFFVHVFKEILAEAGILVSGDLYDGSGLPQNSDYRTESTLAATWFSPPLSEIVYILNKRSQNLFADNLLKTLGSLSVLSRREQEFLPVTAPFFFPQVLAMGNLRPGNNPEPVHGSHRDGFRAAFPVFARAGVDTTRLQLADGSGLSRANLVTPEMTTAILRYMWHHPDETVRNAFIESLPRGGEEIGTLRTMFRSGAAHASVAAKTGTIGNARALSGYVTAADGTPLAFSIMINHHTFGNVRVNQVIERIVNTLAEWEP